MTQCVIGIMPTEEGVGLYLQHSRGLQAEERLGVDAAPAFFFEVYAADRVFAAVSCPPQPSDSVRFLAELMARSLTSAFGPSLTLVGSPHHFVDPDRWRAELQIDVIAQMYGLEKPAAAARFCEMQESGLMRTFDDHLIAEAACTAIWGTRTYQLAARMAQVEMKEKNPIGKAIGSTKAHRGRRRKR